MHKSKKYEIEHVKAYLRKEMLKTGTFLVFQDDFLAFLETTQTDRIDITLSIYQSKLSVSYLLYQNKEVTCQSYKFSERGKAEKKVQEINKKYADIPVIINDCTCLSDPIILLPKKMYETLVEQLRMYFTINESLRILFYKYTLKDHLHNLVNLYNKL